MPFIAMASCVSPALADGATTIDWVSESTPRIVSSAQARQSDLAKARQPDLSKARQLDLKTTPAAWSPSREEAPEPRRNEVLSRSDLRGRAAEDATFSIDDSGRDMDTGGVKVTLVQAIRRGLAINPAVRGAVAEARSAGTEVEIAEWGYYPTVDLSVGPEEFPFQEWGYDASARQMLYDWGRIASEVDSATAAERESLRAVAIAEEEAALDIAEVYLDILAATRQVALIRRYIDDLDALRELASARGQDGYTDRSERGRVALDLAQARDDLATTLGQLDEAQRQLRILTGLSALPLTSPSPTRLTAFLTDERLEQWIVNAPGYQQAIASAEQAQAEVAEAEASLKPQLNLEGSLQRRQIGGDLQNDSVIGLRLRMDTLQGLANFQRPQAARQRLEAARYGIEEQQRDIRRAIVTAIANADVYEAREVALRDQIDEAESVASLYEDQFSVGLRDINDLLTIRQEAFTARRQLVDIEIEQKRIQYRAASRLGVINPLVSERLEGALP